MRTFIRIYPEFDNISLRLSIPDRRYLTGKRIEKRILVGTELYTKNEFKKLCSYCTDIPLTLLGEEIKCKSENIYWFFGARFADYDSAESEITRGIYCDKKKAIRKDIIKLILNATYGVNSSVSKDYQTANLNFMPNKFLYAMLSDEDKDKIDQLKILI